MASGCIPVILNNSVLYPYEQPAGIVPYADFAHVFPFDQAHVVVSVLQAESEAERRRRRRVQRLHYRKFLWDEEHGDAFEWTLRAIQLAAAKQT